MAVEEAVFNDPRQMEQRSQSDEELLLDNDTRGSSGRSLEVRIPLAALGLMAFAVLTMIVRDELGDRPPAAQIEAGSLISLQSEECVVDTSNPQYFSAVESFRGMTYCYKIEWPADQEKMLKNTFSFDECVCDEEDNRGPIAASAQVHRDSDCEEITDQFEVEALREDGECSISFLRIDNVGQDPGETFTYCFKVASATKAMCKGVTINYETASGDFTCRNQPGACCECYTTTPEPEVTTVAVVTTSSGEAGGASTTTEAAAPATTSSLATPSPTPVRPPTCRIPCGKSSAANARRLTAEECPVDTFIRGWQWPEDQLAQGLCLEYYGGYWEDPAGRIVQPTDVTLGGSQGAALPGETCETAWEQIKRNASDHTGSSPNATVPCENLLVILRHLCSPLCSLCDFC